MYIHSRGRRIIAIVVFFSILFFCSVLFYALEEEPKVFTALSLELPNNILPFVIAVDSNQLLENFHPAFDIELSSARDLFLVDWGSEGGNLGWGPFQPVNYDEKPYFSLEVYDYEEHDGTLESSEGIEPLYAREEVIDEELIEPNASEEYAYEEEEMQEIEEISEEPLSMAYMLDVEDPVEILDTRDLVEIVELVEKVEVVDIEVVEEEKEEVVVVVAEVDIDIERRVEEVEVEVEVEEVETLVEEPRVIEEEVSMVKKVVEEVVEEEKEEVVVVVAEVDIDIERRVEEIEVPVEEPRVIKEEVSKEVVEVEVVEVVEKIEEEVVVAQEEQPSTYQLFTHEVSAGETLWSIAREYDVDIETIVGANPQLNNANQLSIGQNIHILSEKGVVHEVYRGETLWEIARTYNITVEDIVKANHMSSDDIIREGDDLFIPGVSSAQRPVRYMWPVSGPISSYFGPRWGRMHEGIDIVVPVGTPVKATRSGRVTLSGWVGAYGYVVYIDHGDGISSRYAHNSRLLVRPGDYVNQGQTIALSGSTGQSTGPHVHFEIRERGRPINPLSYLQR